MRPVLIGALAALAAVGARAGEPGFAPSASPFEELAPQRLAAGQCALVLWSRATPARRIVMALDPPGVARLRLGSGMVELARDAAEGERISGHAPVQRFSGGGASLTLAVEIERRVGLVDGAVIPSGSIDYRDAGGWSVVVPVAGLVACQR